MLSRLTSKAFQCIDRNALLRIVTRKMPCLLRKVIWMSKTVNVFVRMESGDLQVNPMNR